MSRVRLVATAGLACLVALGWAPAAAQSRGGHQPRTPIRHVISLMQENHSFDDYFGTYPGADGIPADVCMPKDLDNPSEGCVRPFHIAGRPITDLGHSREVFQRQYRGGRLDGFVSAYRHEGLNGENSMGYYDDRNLPYYWNVADRYVLFDRFFTSAAAGSVWNHLYWVTGTPGNFQADAVPKRGLDEDLPTIFDRLQAAGVSWKFYVQNYDPTITYRTATDASKGDKVSQVIWVPPLLYARFLDDPELSSHIVDLDEYFQDLRKGTLPAVSYIVPSGASEHPPGSIQAGERFVRGLLNALAGSSAWKDSAFLWTYDWGGWYDHVRPPQVDKYGYGPRAPALLVSAYAKRGEVVHTQLDFTSILRFITDNWDLKPLAERDAKANSIADGLDFTRPPRPPEYIPAERAPPTTPEAAKRPVIYSAYGIALVFAAALLALSSRLAGWSGPWLRGRRPGTST